MKQVLIAIGLVAVSLFAACESGPSTDSNCATCEANAAVQAAVPNAPEMECASCLSHEKLAHCEACDESGEPCSEGCEAKMACESCEDGKMCDSCEVDSADYRFE